MRIIDEIPGLYRVLELEPFRKTEGVSFDIFPMEALPRVDAIDRVIHKKSAISPGKVGEVERPWYMHPHQEDNLLVLFGRRDVEVYSRSHGRIESFTAYPDRILKNGKLLHEGGAILVWPTEVFHRITSGEEGSASVNLAVHHPGFDIATNFNIYDLDPATGEYRVLRYGFEDQNQPTNPYS